MENQEKEVCKLFCSHCGHSYDGNLKFCPNCGAPVQPPQPNYQQPGSYQNGTFGGYRVPIQNRNIAVCVILSIVTCGIYGIYWFVCIVNDLNVASEKPQDTSGGMVFLLSLVTCGIYLFYYKAGEKVSYIKQRNGGTSDNNAGLLYLLLAIFGLGIVSYCLIQSELNNVSALPAS